MSTAESARRPLAVWLVNPFDDVPGEGLPPLRYWSLARVLAARGHAVTWWSADWSHRRKAKRHLPPDALDGERFALRLVPVRPYRKNVSLSRVASHRDYAAHVEAAARVAVATGELARPDVILASLPPLDGPEATVRLARTFDARAIVDLMDLWPETFERLIPGPAAVRRLAVPLLLGGMRRRRRRVLAEVDGVSAATATYLEGVRGDLRQGTATHVCYLGADLEDVAVPAAGVDGARPPGGLECVYAGSLAGGQDLAIVPEAVQLLSQRGVAATIHIAGTGALQAMLAEAAGRARGPCRLVVHGLLARPEYGRLLAACGVGLVLVKPESRVAVPYKACDYAAAGLALVNALPGELQALIDRHGAGVAYRAGSAESLADTIAALAADRDGVARMQAGSRALASDAFDRRLTFIRFAEWIEHIAARDAPTRIRGAGA